LTVPNIGPTELIIVLVIVLLIFGPKRLPGLGRQLGSGMREFKDSITSRDKQDKHDDHEDARAQANAALGRGEEPLPPTPATTTVDSDVAQDRTAR
jgi:sec-independent protein translocase protein TatA